MIIVIYYEINMILLNILCRINLKDDPSLSLSVLNFCVETPSCENECTVEWHLTIIILWDPAMEDIRRKVEGFDV